MKKVLLILSLVLITALMMPTATFAMQGKGNPTGEVTAIDEAGGTLSLLLADGETLVVTLPDDFDYTAVSVGTTVTVKGKWTEDGITAQWVKESDPEDTTEAAEEEAAEATAEAEEDADDDADDEDKDGDEEKGEGGIYCTEGKDSAHPLATKIAEDYGVSEAWVMEKACEGGGFGSVMLALQTADLTGEDADSVLEARKNGKGWGQLWKDAGLVGKDHADTPPPGQLKKPDKGNGNGPPDDKGKPDDAGKPDDNDNGNGNNGNDGNNGKGSDKGNGSNNDDNDNEDD